MPTCRGWKTGIEFWKWRPYKVRSLVSNSIYAKKDRNGPPSANQVASKDDPRHSHAVCTFRVHPPTSPSPALSAHAEPKSQGHCWKWHHEAESLMTDISAMGPKELRELGRGWGHDAKKCSGCGCTLQNLCEGIRKGEGGDELNITMMQSIHRPVGDTPLPPWSPIVIAYLLLL